MSIWLILTLILSVWLVLKWPGEIKLVQILIDNSGCYLILGKLWLVLFLIRSILTGHFLMRSFLIGPYNDLVEPDWYIFFADKSWWFFSVFWSIKYRLLFWSGNFLQVSFQSGLVQLRLVLTLIDELWLHFFYQVKFDWCLIRSIFLTGPFLMALVLIWKIMIVPSFDQASWLILTSTNCPEYLIWWGCFV